MCWGREVWFLSRELFERRNKHREGETRQRERQRDCCRDAELDCVAYRALGSHKEMPRDQKKACREVWSTGGVVAIFYRKGRRREEKIQSPKEFKLHLRKLFQAHKEQESEASSAHSSAVEENEDSSGVSEEVEFFSPSFPPSSEMGELLSSSPAVSLKRALEGPSKGGEAFPAVSRRISFRGKGKRCRVLSTRESVVF